MSQCPRWASVFSGKTVYDLNDGLNADILYHMLGADYRYWVELGNWLRWGGHKWVEDTGQSLFDRGRRHLPEALHLIATKYVAPRDQSEKKTLVTAWRKWARRAGNKATMSAAIDTMKTDHRCQVRTEQLDVDQDKLAVKNGIVDLVNGELVSHSSDKPLVTQASDVVFNPRADTRDWEKTVLKICCGDEQLADWLHRAVGYSITGRTTEQVLFMCSGRGSNGKSTLFSMLRKALGDHALFANWKTIEEEKQNRGEGPRPDLIRLFGRRLMVVDEPENNSPALNEGLVKRMTGGTEIVARTLHEKTFVEFELTSKIWVAFNSDPRIKGSDEGIWRRIRRIPFNAYFTAQDEDFDPGIKDRLDRNLESILLWAIRGAQLYYQEGLDWCDAVQQSTSDYRSEQDTLHDFLAMAVESSPPDHVYAQDLYDDYVHYCRQYNVPSKGQVAQQTFNARLKERGWKSEKKGNRRLKAWVGFKNVFTGRGQQTLQ